MDLLFFLDPFEQWMNSIDPGLFTTMLFVVGFGLPVALCIFWARRASKPVRGGVAGTARVVSASGNSGRAFYQTCAMDLVVEAPGLPPTAVRYRAQVPSSRWPFPGQTLPVSVNPRRPTRVTIPWRRVPKNSSLGMAAAQAVATGLRGGSTGRSASSFLGGLLGAGIQNTSFDSVQIVGDMTKLTPTQRENLRLLGVDPERLLQTSPEMGFVVELERLNSLRQSGALTEPEFQREKARLLNRP